MAGQTVENNINCGPQHSSLQTVSSVQPMSVPTFRVEAYSPEPVSEDEEPIWRTIDWNQTKRRRRSVLLAKVELTRKRQKCSFSVVSPPPKESLPSDDIKATRAETGKAIADQNLTQERQNSHLVDAAILNAESPGPGRKGMTSVRNPISGTWPHSSQTLTAVQESQKGPRQYPCPTCLEEFSSLELGKHINTTCSTPHTCQKCNRHFATKQGLYAHRKRKTGCLAEQGISPDAGPHTCPRCGRNFTTRLGLLTHMGKNTARCLAAQGSSSDTLWLTCHKCKRNFATRKGLLTHMIRKTARCLLEQGSNSDAEPLARAPSKVDQLDQYSTVMKF